MTRYVLALLPACLGCENGFLLTEDPRPPQTLVVVEQPQIGDTSLVLAIGGSWDPKLAQVVTSPVTGELVDVWLRPAGGGSVQLDIEDVTGLGAPGGVSLLSQTLDFEMPPPTALVRFALETPVALEAGARFAIVLHGGLGAIYRGPEGDPYPGGSAWFEALPNPPGWVPQSEFEGDDLPFRARFAPVESP